MENSSLYNSYKTFSNNEFGSVRVFEINNEPWFVGKDVAEVLGYKEPRSVVSRRISAENKMLIKMPTNGGFQDMTIINEKALNIFIQTNKNTSQKRRTKILKWLIDEKLIKSKSVLITTKESEFIYELKQALKPFSIKGKTQYRVLMYMIDYYMPSLNIAIEYDENNHDHYSYERHEGRQIEIEKELGCRFIRVSDKKSNSYNIGLVIKEIFNL